MFRLSRLVPRLSCSRSRAFIRAIAIASLLPFALDRSAHASVADNDSLLNVTIPESVTVVFTNGTEWSLYSGETVAFSIAPWKGILFQGRAINDANEEPAINRDDAALLSLYGAHPLVKELRGNGASVQEAVQSLADSVQATEDAAIEAVRSIYQSRQNLEEATEAARRILSASPLFVPGSTGGIIVSTVQPEVSLRYTLLGDSASELILVDPNAKPRRISITREKARSIARDLSAACDSAAAGAVISLRNGEVFVHRSGKVLGK